MSNKVIDEKTLTNPEEFQKAQALITSIKSRHTVIARETNAINAEKEEIGKISSKIFFDDIANPAIPEIYQNHDYSCDAGIVHINFRVGSAPVVAKSNETEPDKKLREALGEDVYKAIFKENVQYQPVADQAKLINQAQDNPDVFQFKLKEGIPVDKLINLVKTFPELVEVGIKDVEKYASAFPACVNKKVSVQPQNDFLKKVDKLEGAIKSKIRKFLGRFLTERIQPVVMCGNTSEETK